MPDCEACGKAISAGGRYTCSYCRGDHCADHRLPEKHDCKRIESATSLGPDFNGKRGTKGDAITYPEESESASGFSEFLLIVALAILLLFLVSVVIPGFFR